MTAMKVKLLASIPLAVCLAIGGVETMASAAVTFVARWGGATKDIAYAIVTNEAKYLFVVGATYSRDYPVTAGAAPSGDTWCAFVTKLSKVSGSVIYSTTLCSRGMTFGRAAAPAAGGLWVGGATDGRGLPVSADAVQ